MAYNYPPENLKKWLHFLESEDFLPKARELDGPWKSPQEIEILALHDKIDLFGLGFYVLWVDAEPNRSVKIPASTLQMRKNCWIPTKLILLQIWPHLKMLNGGLYWVWGFVQLWLMKARYFLWKKSEDEVMNLLHSNILCCPIKAVGLCNFHEEHQRQFVL